MTTLRLAVAGARAQRGPLTASFLVLGLAAALLSVTGVLIQSGTGAGGGMLAALAGSFAGTAIVVVILVVASTVGLSLRQRRRELALLRAIGATRRQVRRLVAAELGLVTAVAGPIGAAAGMILAGRLTPVLVDGGVVADGFDMTMTPVPALSAIALLVPVALVAASLATRETVRTPPTEAVRQSIVEPQAVGRGRRLTALVLTVFGLAVALTPVVVSGTIGAASAASSAFLLVGAAALAGPLLVAWCLNRHGLLRLLSRGPAGRLAVANTRGFSRRLTTAIVPLALALAAGTVQSTTNRTVAEASTRQLAAGLQADLVVAPADGLSDRQTASLSGTPGVDSVVALSSTMAQLRVEPKNEDVPALDGLSWESASVRILPEDVGSTVDPDVQDGSLADLGRPDTVAVSRDALFATGVGVGDTVGLRLGGEETEATVVATYERGLGFGDYLTGVATARAHRVSTVADTALLVTSSPGEVRRALADQGVTAVDEAAYVDRAATAGAGERRLSLVLLLSLLAFIVLAAANTLVMTTAGRWEEFALLHRTGATRRQLIATATVESIIAAVTAWAIGTAAVVPAVLGVGFGLLGASGPRVDLTTYAALSALTVLIALGTVIPTVARQTLGVRRSA